MYRVSDRVKLFDRSQNNEESAVSPSEFTDKLRHEKKRITSRQLLSRSLQLTSPEDNCHLSEKHATKIKCGLKPVDGDSTKIRSADVFKKLNRADLSLDFNSQISLNREDVNDVTRNEVVNEGTEINNERDTRSSPGAVTIRVSLVRTEEDANFKSESTSKMANSSDGLSIKSHSAEAGNTVASTKRSLRNRVFADEIKIGDRDYIGFATLPEQIHRKSVKRGFDFTLMVVGESGLGKSTLVNSLFLSDLYKDKKIPDVAEKLERTTVIERKTMDIEERGVKLRLTVVDTPGFGDALNCDDSWKVVVNYIDDQFRQYFTDESGLNRKNIQDNRVHCCLYFIPPYGHGLRQIDVELMKRLHQKVNIVPIIAKADALTLPEVKKLKQRILDDITENGIQIYQFPECDSDEDDEFKQQDKELKASLPFSVIGSNTVIEVEGSRTRGRQYPWGVVEVENPHHSDFNKLRNMLITTHMQDLKDVTEDVHYENFRAQCISQISQQAFRERGKLKRDSVPLNMDPTMITETDRLLLQKDEEIRRMQDMLAQMQQKLKATTLSNDNIVNI